MICFRRYMFIKKSCLSSVRNILLTYNHTGCIIIEPSTSLVTDRLKIFGNGFEPNAPITIKASVECETENISFKSNGHFITSKDGDFDLSLCESIGGTYEGVDSMGLFWSMVEKENSLNRFQVRNASIPKQYKFSVYGGHQDLDSEEGSYCHTYIERRFIGENVKRSYVKIGNFNGTLFTPPGEGPFGAIITFYGSNKRRHVIEDAAAILSNSGFITLAIQYFGSEGLPAVYSLEPIKLEEFEAVVDYLHALENCHSVGIYGISKGGEIAIAMMSHLPQVKAVASINGHIASVGSTTTYGGKTTPELGMNLELLQFLPNGAADGTNVLNNPEEEPLTIHPLEFSSADLLLVVGLDDCNWRSEESADIAKKRMDSVGKTNYEISKLHGMGHLVDAPFMPICTLEGHILLPKNMKLYYGGGNKKMHASSQEMVWDKVISFFCCSLS